MTCGRVQRRLADHIEGQVRGLARRRVERHLGRCRDCSWVFHSLVRTVEGLRALGGRTSAVPASRLARNGRTS